MYILEYDMWFLLLAHCGKVAKLPDLALTATDDSSVNALTIQA